MQTISFILSTLGLIAMVCSSLVKGQNMKKILVLVFLSNFLIATSYIFVHNGNGAVSCYIGAFQAITNYFFDSKNKPLPVWLIVVYALAFVVANLLVFTGPIDILAIVASLIFILCVGQKSGAKYRFFILINVGLWCLYDAIKMAYGPLTTHTIILLFNIAGMLIHDRTIEKNKNQNMLEA